MLIFDSTEDTDNPVALILHFNNTKNNNNNNNNNSILYHCLHHLYQKSAYQQLINLIQKKFKLLPEKN
jgi:hypothetical protein